MTAKRILVLCPTPIEAKWLVDRKVNVNDVIQFNDNTDVYVIGCHDKSKELREFLKNRKYNFIIIFGCCGLLQSDIPYNIPLSPYFIGHYENEVLPIQANIEFLTTVPCTFVARALTVNSHIHSSKIKNAILNRYPDAVFVDAESYHFAKVCNDLDIPFVVLRYPVDRCDKKLMPTGINHFYRIFQHWRHGRKFRKILIKRN